MQKAQKKPKSRVSQNSCNWKSHRPQGSPVHSCFFSRSQEPSVRSGDRCVHKTPPVGGAPGRSALQLVGSRVCHRSCFTSQKVP
eukprot:s57_g44.t1